MESFNLELLFFNEFVNKKDCRATGGTNGTNGGTRWASQLHIGTTTKAAGPGRHGIGHMVSSSL
jgi:hypothetical protein